MAYIGESRRDSSHPWEIVECLTKNEAATILPTLERRLKLASERVEYFEGIHEAGELNASQEIHLMKWQDEEEILQSIVNSINELIKQ